MIDPNTQAVAPDYGTPKRIPDIDAKKQPENKSHATSECHARANELHMRANRPLPLPYPQPGGNNKCPTKVQKARAKDRKADKTGEMMRAYANFLRTGKVTPPFGKKLALLAGR
ncbi:uncharacterized protein LTR77_005351 [Saxophila tyrrhenica]|uniref:Uncharacterized protein n=1 Tax=Saxophila tyrrhenica TaxID=1690608 RepID=A0AAV9P8G7_9PEZI|nr:hypothetical protein LTR77_005351 [Saxophila tyrrhenica]